MKSAGEISAVENSRIISIKHTWQRFQGLKCAAGEKAMAQGKTVMGGLEKLGLIVRLPADESADISAGWNITEKGSSQLTAWKSLNKR